MTKDEFDTEIDVVVAKEQGRETVLGLMTYPAKVYAPVGIPDEFAWVQMFIIPRAYSGYDVVEKWSGLSVAIWDLPTPKESAPFRGLVFFSPEMAAGLQERVIKGILARADLPHFGKQKHYPHKWSEKIPTIWKA